MKTVTGNRLKMAFARWIVTTTNHDYQDQRSGFMRFLPGHPPLPLIIASMAWDETWEVNEEAHKLIVTLCKSPQWDTLIKIRCIQQSLPWK